MRFPESSSFQGKLLRWIKGSMGKAFRIAVNNPLLNSAAAWCGADPLLCRLHHQWVGRNFNPAKSLQENVGFSHREDVEAALSKVHGTLWSFACGNLEEGASILDLGSGTGLIAKRMSSRFKIVGIDISEELTRVARKENPQCEFHVGDFLSFECGSDFALIYSIGVLMYFPPSRLRLFFERAHEVLRPGGYLFLQYSHALKRSDLWFPDISSIKYSPAIVERCAAEFFKIEAHHHSFFEEKIVQDYDRDPFPMDSFVNGYLLIARRP
ncbi:Methyltransferase type 11 [Syntrophobacter fumaroxidans MPOB]|uniref:Methyltransferase type 11 n=2 Tax=Syntrophobacter TaxID=29526 RepID=A0LNM1_SYNFM|nr:Methyltransferase type 11 [Syntrophobacter fumaroxidans MPOB]